MAIVASGNFNQVRDSVRHFASGFTRGQKAVTLGALAIVGVLAVIFMSISGRPTYSILFTNLEASDAASITQQLASDHVPYQLQNGGSTILVPENDVDQERLAAAQAGLPANSTVGLSILDNEGLTTSELTQQADYLRALQGELEQTINSISGVEGSQVSIAMPANQTFVLGTTNPTGASVLVELAPNHELTYDQVEAITSLVSSAVPGLTASQVTVADSAGDLLAGPGVSDNGSQQTNAASAYDDATAAKVMSYLTGVLGAGNADVQVNAQLDFDQVKTSTQALIAGKNGQPVTSCTSTQTSTTKYTGSGAPPGSSLGTSSASGNYTQVQSQKSCETGSETSTVTQAPGSVKQQSVAVLVNSRALPKGISLTALQQGTAAAAGISSARGDTLSFSTAPFATTAPTKAVKTSMLTTYMKPGLAFVLVLLLVVLLLLASRRARKHQRNVESMPDSLALDQYYSMPPELTTAELPVVPSLMASPLQAISSLQTIVDNQTEDVARVLTGWLAQR